MSELPETPPAPATPRYDTSLTLLERLRANEPDAWRVFVQLYTPLVYHWCARGGVLGADADDVVQEIFLAVSNHLDGFRRDRAGDTLRGWLRVVTRNMVLLHFRKSGRQPQGSGDTGALARLQELADTTPGPSDDADNEGELDGLRRRALEMVRQDFEERTWHMFWLAVVEERPVADIATELGVTPAAVRKAKSRVLHRLKEEFADLIQ